MMSCSARRINNVQFNVHKFLGRFAKDVLVAILRQGIKGIAKATLANKLEGSPRQHVDLNENFKLGSMLKRRSHKPLVDHSLLF